MVVCSTWVICWLFESTLIVGYGRHTLYRFESCHHTAVIYLSFHLLIMKLTEKQLECMRLGANKTLSFGCMALVSSKGSAEQHFYYIDEDLVFSDRNWVEDMCRDPRIRGIWWVDVDSKRAEIIDIIWHPITRWRLCYLYQWKQSTETIKIIFQINNMLYKQPIMYQQTILDRPEEIIDLVLSFLQSLWT